MLPDQCDFCNQFLDEDEELIPVYFGSPPTPQPIHLKGYHDKGPSRPGSTRRREAVLRGKEIGEYFALIDALRSSDLVEFDTYRSVEEVKPSGEVSIEPNALQKLDSVINEQKAAAEVRIHADFDEPEPDMMVCEHCEEAING